MKAKTAIDQSAIILMYRMGGVTVRELADKFGISQKAVRHIVHTARPETGTEPDGIEYFNFTGGWQGHRRSNVPVRPSAFIDRN